MIYFGNLTRIIDGYGTEVEGYTLVCRLESEKNGILESATVVWFGD